MLNYSNLSYRQVRVRMVLVITEQRLFVIITFMLTQRRTAKWKTRLKYNSSPQKIPLLVVEGGLLHQIKTAE